MTWLARAIWAGSLRRVAFLPNWEAAGWKTVAPHPKLLALRPKLDRARRRGSTSLLDYEMKAIIQEISWNSSHMNKVLDA
jgi:hypothetical protein